jgi:predicted NAD/FAD-binding protein
MSRQSTPQSIVVIGSGIAGLSCAWLLANHGRKVTLLEADDRAGGHTNTVDACIDGRKVAVDTGFIVFNEENYPNLTRLFAHLGLETIATDMSFSYSGQGLEYAGGRGLKGIFAQPYNALRPDFLALLMDIRRFYTSMRGADVPSGITLDQLLLSGNYSPMFADRHLKPMAAAIWSTDVDRIGNVDARSFVDFFTNHGLFELDGRPQWRTVAGGSGKYVGPLLEAPIELMLNAPVDAVDSINGHVEVSVRGKRRCFDAAVVATHSDQALALLGTGTAEEKRILSAFSYTPCRAYLHCDPAFMPKRRRAWASWNYLEQADGSLSVTYWMNNLQRLATHVDLFVTLDPTPEPEGVLAVFDYTHPVFDTCTARLQSELWDLQGRRNIWFCGAWFGHGFHEDGLQAGLAVAEEISGGARPWGWDRTDHPRVAVAPRHVFSA